jgi:hypothetical protein
MISLRNALKVSKLLKIDKVIKSMVYSITVQFIARKFKMSNKIGYNYG